MLLFTASTSLLKEVETGTIKRLILSKMNTTELILSLTIIQTVLSTVSLAFAYSIAILLGYKTVGSLFLSIVVCILTAISMIGFSIIVAALCNTVNQILTVGVFPFFLMFFFTGAAFPLPSLKVIEFEKFTIHLNDILSPTHATNAIGKILNVGLGIESILYEIVSIGVLTIIYFYIGIILFHKQHLKKL
jgi:ABC-2 type transport system permease protein